MTTKAPAVQKIKTDKQTKSLEAFKESGISGQSGPNALQIVH